MGRHHIGKGGAAGGWDWGDIHEADPNRDNLDLEAPRKAVNAAHKRSGNVKPGPALHSDPRNSCSRPTSWQEQVGSSPSEGQASGATSGRRPIIKLSASCEPPPVGPLTRALRLGSVREGTH